MCSSPAAATADPPLFPPVVPEGVPVSIAKSLWVWLSEPPSPPYTVEPTMNFPSKSPPVPDLTSQLPEEGVLLNKAIIPKGIEVSESASARVTFMNRGLWSPGEVGPAPVFE